MGGSAAAAQRPVLELRGRAKGEHRLIGLGNIKAPNHAECGVRGLVGAVLKIAEKCVGPAGLKVDR